MIRQEAIPGQLQIEAGIFVSTRPAGIDEVVATASTHCVSANAEETQMP
jgi:hypothetical protein